MSPEAPKPEGQTPEVTPAPNEIVLPPMPEAPVDPTPVVEAAPVAPKMVEMPPEFNPNPSGYEPTSEEIEAELDDMQRDVMGGAEARNAARQRLIDRANMSPEEKQAYEAAQAAEEARRAAATPVVGPPPPSTNEAQVAEQITSPTVSPVGPPPESQQ